ncbi:MAG: hypothetical protein UX44_C0007G0011 [candidate division WWE3 bacterium GW2011_GWA1_46_21]|uniref:Uncharacterized protein n=3 Tax=Katanobacteria TaxID=422282 RepID=A0A0G1PEX2_UNCKA|nr:MAG: hypothetical protein UX44_C0007G0011 [candidate division WWE3 bacterium GW2011_GWA1_46_21]KKU50800.1 MAG: seg [candidate division WWE3 bacterium GW2011_GWC1_47_10]KKU57578.1 MAG: hypothetical protein UX79_C0008G0012 [candidate division WWE3 bacterium GW2011_GWB1_47_11]
MNLIDVAYAVSNTVTDPLGGQYQSLSAVFGVIINIALGVGVALTIVFLILGGIQYVMSKGDQKAAQQARDWLTNAVIGFIVVLGALTIRVIVEKLLGADTGSIDTTVVPVTN